MKEKMLFGFLLMMMVFSLCSANQWTEIDLTNSGLNQALLQNYFEGITNFTSVYDEANNRIIFYGGLLGNSGGEGSVSGNIAAFDLDTEEFTLLCGAATNGGRERYNHSAVYDPINQEMIIFGGRTSFYYDGMDNPNGTDQPVESGNIPNNDCWAFDLAVQEYDETAWRKIDTPIDPGVNGVDRPEYRENHSAVYDPINHQMLIFGGTNKMLYEPESISAVQYDDVWALDLNTYTWTKVYSNSESVIKKSEGQTAVYDSYNHQAVIFSGWCEQYEYVESKGYWRGDYIKEIYAYNIENNAFTVWLPDNTPEVLIDGIDYGFGREGHSAVYDPIGREMLIMGGTFGLSAFGQSDIPQSFYALDLGSSSNGIWRELPQPSSWTNQYGPRYYHNAVYAETKMYIFFGKDIYNNPPMSSLNIYGDMWTYQLPETDIENNISEAQRMSVFPNPFNPQTTISFELKGSSRVSIYVYDISGKIIDTVLEDKLLPNGLHSFSWKPEKNDKNSFSSGVYFIKAVTPEFSETKKVLLIK